jgi:hypothetical protein
MELFFSFVFGTTPPKITVGAVCGATPNGAIVFMSQGYEESSRVIQSFSTSIFMLEIVVLDVDLVS